MPCPECGNEKRYFDDVDIIQYQDGAYEVVRLEISEQICLECGYMDVRQVGAQTIPIPPRTARYFVEFDAQWWYVVDSFDEDYAIDSFEEIEQAIQLRDELNSKDPYRVLNEVE